MTGAQAAIEYFRAMRFAPYIYGGNAPEGGIDCSGAVGEVLRAFGLMRNGEDRTAQLIYDLFAHLPNVKPEPGALLFFGDHARDIEHVALATSSWRMIESGGGGKNTIDMGRANRLAAMVRERPIAARLDLVKVVVPPWPIP